MKIENITRAIVLIRAYEQLEPISSASVDLHSMSFWDEDNQDFVRVEFDKIGMPKDKREQILSILREEFDYVVKELKAL